MTVTQRGALRADAFSFLDHAAAFIATHTFERPTLVVSRNRISAQYDALQTGLDGAALNFAVSANPADDVVRLLVEKGAGFLAQSRGEIETCLNQGARPGSIVFGALEKTAGNIAFAHAVGVRRFAADSAAEIDRIAEAAPGATLWLRVAVVAASSGAGAGQRAGCTAGALPRLLDRALAAGLEVDGLSFHAGSQIRDAAFWDDILESVVPLWQAARAAGHDLQSLDIGGGFPAFYGQTVQAPRVYAARVMAAVRARFGDAVRVSATPGRVLVAEAGHLVTSVLRVTRMSDTDLHRHVTLDIPGFADPASESIRYQFVTPRDGSETGPCVLTAASAAGAGVLYGKRPVQLPQTLCAGDRVVVRNCGAYLRSDPGTGAGGRPGLDIVVL